MNAIDDLEQKLVAARAELAAAEASLHQRAESFAARLQAQSFKRHVEELEHQLYLARATRAREVIQWHLKGPRLTDGSIPLRLIARLADHFGRAVASGAWRIRYGRDARALPNYFIELIDLRLADIRAGSSRLFLTGNTAPDLAGHSLLGESLAHTFDLLQAKPSGMLDPVGAIGVKATRLTAEWLRALQEEGAAAELIWTDDRNVSHEWGALPSDIAQLRDRIAAMTEEVPSEEEHAGEVTMLAETGRVQFRVGDRRITARYPRDLFPLVQQLQLGARVRFKVEHSRLHNAITETTTDRYTLLALEIPSAG